MGTDKNNTTRGWNTMLEAGQGYSDGTEFLEDIREVEESWEACLLEWITSTSPKDVPSLFDTLGEVLVHLDRISSCIWNCEEMEGDHLERHMIARITSNARAAIRLLLSGYLGEAASIIRSMLEVASLMYLFMESESDREQFRTQNVHGREADFSHRKVARRIRILQGGNSNHLAEFATVSEEVFGEFSQAFTHFTKAWPPLTLSISEFAEMNEPFMRTATLMGLVSVATLVGTAAIFADDLFEHLGERKALLALNLELNEAAVAYQHVVKSQLRST